MIVQIYAIKDRVTGIFDGPHKAHNDGDFLRSFANICERENTPINNQPEDFCAVHLGSYNDSTGVVVPLEGGPKRIAEAGDFVIKE
jgi:hypothetical protein